MADKEKIPAIRFKGFTDEWEEKKLGDCIEIGSGKDYKHLLKGNIPVYGTGGYMLSVNEALSNNNDAIGVGRKGTIDKPFILKAPFWTVDTLFYCLPKSKNELNFIFNIFQIIDWKQKDESTGVPSLSKISINSVNIRVAKLPEQTQIGKYFNELDEMVALQEQKLEKVKHLKKAMLEKMFPTAHADSPEIRFKGFTDKWQKKTLGEVAEFNKGKGYSKNDLKEKGLPIILYGRLYTRYESVINVVNTYSYTKSETYLSNGNEVIVPASGETSEDIARASAVVKPGIILGGDLNIIYPPKYIDSIFLAIYLTYGNSNKEISKRAKGKSVVHVHNSDLKQVFIDYPSLPEQQKIGSYFQNLDELISQSQQKIKQLKNLKQALLKKMFI